MMVYHMRKVPLTLQKPLTTSVEYALEELFPLGTKGHGPCLLNVVYVFIYLLDLYPAPYGD